ncbi:hypothetical protein CDIK_4379 [Cucumispora dikerogammari]|nr:hypothetical protein CDIK_4379 [Cucumispora dikerogammari]
MPKNILNEHILRLIRTKIELGRTLKQISAELGFKYDLILRTVKKIIDGKTDLEICNFSKRKSRRETTVLYSKLASIVDTDNLLNQTGMKFLLEKDNIIRSQPTISRSLKRMNISRKILSRVPSNKNSPRVLELRYSYARECELFSSENFVYLDETGFNLHTTTNYGYSLVNTKAFVNVVLNRGQNISLLAAISSREIVGFDIQQGAFNGDLLKVFIEQKLAPYFRINRTSVLVMDNCRFHHRADVINLLNEKRITYKFLPPYSPMLNPIEEFFAKIKANYKNIRPLSKNKNEIIRNLEHILSSGGFDLLAFYKHAEEYLQLALLRRHFI